MPVGSDCLHEVRNHDIQFSFFSEERAAGDIAQQPINPRVQPEHRNSDILKPKAIKLRAKLAADCRSGVPTLAV